MIAVILCSSPVSWRLVPAPNTGSSSSLPCPQNLSGLFAFSGLSGYGANSYLVTRRKKMKTMTASVASKEFGRYLDAVQREPIVVTKKNRAVAVTVSIQDWEELLQHRIEQGITQGLRDVDAGRFEVMNDASTARRIAAFKVRNSTAT